MQPFSTVTPTTNTKSTRRSTLQLLLTALNDTFETELVHNEEGHEKGSESFNITIPLSRAPRIYNVSMREDLSFDPVNFGQLPTTP